MSRRQGGLNYSVLDLAVQLSQIFFSDRTIVFNLLRILLSFKGELCSRIGKSVAVWFPLLLLFGACHAASCSVSLMLTSVWKRHPSQNVLSKKAGVSQTSRRGQNETWSQGFCFWKPCGFSFEFRIYFHQWQLAGLFFCSRFIII